MLATSHALAGATIAQTFWPHHPFLGYLLALASHPLLDVIPHWDFNTRAHRRPRLTILIISLTDAGVGVILSLVLFRSIPLAYFLSVIFLAQAPDWLEAPYHLFNWHFPPFSTIKRLQSRWHHKLKLPWGLIIQLVFLGALYVLTSPRIYPN